MCHRPPVLINFVAAKLSANLYFIIVIKMSTYVIYYLWRLSANRFIDTSDFESFSLIKFINVLCSDVLNFYQYTFAIWERILYPENGSRRNRQFCFVNLKLLIIVNFKLSIINFKVSIIVKNVNLKLSINTDYCQ